MSQGQDTSLKQQLVFTMSSTGLPYYGLGPVPEAETSTAVWLPGQNEPRLNRHPGQVSWPPTPGAGQGAPPQAHHHLPRSLPSVLFLIMSTQVNLP